MKATKGHKTPRDRAEGICLRGLYGLINGLRAVCSPAFLWIAALGFTAWFLPEPQTRIGLGSLALSALYEEAAFRAGIQQILEFFFSDTILKARITWANLITSLLFALLHLQHHPPGWALAVFIPSLIFGWTWTRYQNLIPCWGLHCVYNVLYFYRP